LQADTNKDKDSDGGQQVLLQPHYAWPWARNFEGCVFFNWCGPGRGRETPQPPEV